MKATAVGRLYERVDRSLHEYIINLVKLISREVSAGMV